MKKNKETKKNMDAEEESRIAGVRSYVVIASKSPIMGRLNVVRSVFAIRGFDREKL